MGLNSQSTALVALQARPVSRVELLPGDILLKSKVWYSGGSGHVLVFAGWSKADMSEYWALEQTSPRPSTASGLGARPAIARSETRNVDGFDRSRVVYGTAFTVTGLATKPVVAVRCDPAVAATSGVVGGSQQRWRASAAGGRHHPGSERALSNRHTPLQSGRYIVRYRAADSNDSTELIARDITVVPGSPPWPVRVRSCAARGRTASTATATRAWRTTLTIAKYNKKKRAYLPYKNVKAAVARHLRSSRGYKFTAKWRPTVRGRSTGITWTTGSPARRWRLDRLGEQIRSQCQVTPAHTLPR